MKKIYFLSICLLACASCQDKTEVRDGKNVINFTSGVEDTRGTLYTTQNLDKYKVKTLVDADNSQYFEDVVTKSNGKWNTTTTHKWKSGDLCFFGYAPENLSGVSADASGLKLQNLTLAQKPSEQKDVVVAYTKGNQSTQINGVALETAVPMVFKHVYSRVEVKAKVVPEFDGQGYDAKTKLYKVEVLGAKIVNVPLSGTVTLSKTNMTTDEQTYNASRQNLWSAITKVNDPSKAIVSVAPESGQAVELNSTDFKTIMLADNSPVFAVPHTLDPWDGKEATASQNKTFIAVLLKMTAGKNLAIQVYPREVGKYGFVAIPISSVQWLPGKKYTYNIVFGHQNISMGVYPPEGSLDDPTNTNDSRIDKNPSTESKYLKPGDPILGPCIDFVNPIVTEWEEVNEELTFE